MWLVADSPETLEACPALSVAFRLLGKRWNAVILDVLAQRPARFSEIHRAVPGLSDRVLGERLKELVEVEVIAHEPAGERLTVYRLTSTGERLLPALDAIRSWALELTDETPRVMKISRAPSDRLQDAAIGDVVGPGDEARGIGG